MGGGEEGSAKSDGYGLAKIVKYHPEAISEISRIIEQGKFIFDDGGRPSLILEDYIVGLKDNWKGKKIPYWVVSSYKKRDSFKGIDSEETKMATKENYSFDYPSALNTTEKTLTQQEEALKLNSEATSKTKLKESDFVSKKQEEILDPQTDPSKINAIINDPRFIEESIQKEATSIANDVSPTQDFVPLFKDTRERIRLQNLAENKTSIIFNDLEDIRADLPYLLKEQVEDVKFAEERFANGGRGVLFTNGTGTGKTLTGLGIIKRKLKAGGRNILILTPSTQKIAIGSRKRSY